MERIRLEGPAAPASAALVTAVSCVTASFCEAVGASSAAQAAAMWNGTSWQPQPTPELGYASVSCVSIDFCQAVGAGGAMMWDGTSWQPESIPAITGGSYSGVSCASAQACEAVGSGQSATGGAFAAAWNGTNWTAQAVLPVPSGAASDTLNGITCTSATACTTVGYSTGSASPFAKLTLAQAWNGTSWSIQPTPSPAATGNELNSVSCTAAGSCTAVGFAPDPGNVNATLVETTG